MQLDIGFFLTNLLLGAGLAMDAFSVSVVNGLNEPCMRRKKMLLVAGIFAAFQFAMPAAGWFCVTTIANLFKAFSKFIPWIAFALLSYIGGKMLYDGIKSKEECGCCGCRVTFSALVVQGVATSIDALSVGFTIAGYGIWEALIACLLIGGITFVICYAGIIIGKKAGTKISGKACIFGGSVLVLIGLKILIESFLK
ncbi:MAG: manganese efflux pump [Clostridia bacterium]|nr:manganese efflux pump [Clostridia bacterium]